MKRSDLDLLLTWAHDTHGYNVALELDDPHGLVRHLMYMDRRLLGPVKQKFIEAGFAHWHEPPTPHNREEEGFVLHEYCIIFPLEPEGRTILFPPIARRSAAD